MFLGTKHLFSLATKHILVGYKTIKKFQKKKKREREREKLEFVQYYENCTVGMELHSWLDHFQLRLLSLKALKFLKAFRYLVPMIFTMNKIYGLEVISLSKRYIIWVWKKGKKNTATRLYVVKTPLSLLLFLQFSFVKLFKQAQIRHKSICVHLHLGSVVVFNDVLLISACATFRLKLPRAMRNYG